MILVIRLTFLAIESVIDLTAEFDLIARVDLTVELLRVEGEIIAIAQPLVILSVVAPWLEFLKADVVGACS